MKDLHGQAIRDYYRNQTTHPLVLHNSYDDPEEMSVEVFFREEEDLSVLEHLALIEAKGSVLDLGAGAGAHALILESRGFDVTALENSPGCIEVMKQSGVTKVIDQNYQEHSATYDTVLVLMNGLGLAGTLQGLTPFLRKCKSLLRPGGQLLIDSSDISYLYECGVDRPKGYYGEVRYCYEYKGEMGEWFDWLYVDQKTLATYVRQAGMQLEILHTEETDQYLARITL
ncbi:class I SAM-dependent methyltransferase [Marinoscillum furvescens]|uniref:Methyltransferase family protein n=1 Tax=Marinoscillum furvescens DSM 4134 TaxID=1122208 RepID=A0A3D9L8T8_MARFU|nr:methyltransferase domain-containing protein [Marinoscillum furvescens]REE02086.1 methyltransferase family protein [Marinoscillum furvescens DSM 4134]